MSGQLAILVSSFDAYSDLWPPYFEAFERNWPDCPFPRYLLSNYKTFPGFSVRPIQVRDVKAWPACMRLALNEISEEFILLLLEDLFIVSKVETDKFLRLSDWITEHRPACIRLQPEPSMMPTQFRGILQLPPGAPYRSSTVLSVWRKDVLLDLLRDDESIWQFEVFGSVRTDKYPDFYVTDEPYLKYLHGVIRGKWIPGAQRKLIAAGIQVLTQARPVFSFRDRIAQLGRSVRARGLRMIPIRYQRRIRLWFSTTGTSAGQTS